MITVCVNLFFEKLGVFWRLDTEVTISKFLFVKTCSRLRFASVPLAALRPDPTAADPTGRDGRRRRRDPIGDQRQRDRPTVSSMPPLSVGDADVVDSLARFGLCETVWPPNKSSWPRAPKPRTWRRRTAI